MASEYPEHAESYEDVAWDENGEGYEENVDDEEYQDEEYDEEQQNDDDEEYGDAQATDDQAKVDNDAAVATDDQHAADGNQPDHTNDPEPMEDEAAEDSGEAEYDPESISIDPAPVPLTTEPPAAVPAQQSEPAPKSKPKPKTSGGFLMADSDDDDDDENDAPAPRAASLAAKAAAASERSSANPAEPAQGHDSTTATPVNGGASVAPPTTAAAPSAASSTVAQVAPAVTVPGDAISQLEERISEEPRGDMDAWLSLMAEYRRLGQVDQLRQLYERFVGVFPQAAEIWIEWINFELESMNTTAAETLFQRSLLNVSNVPLWTAYINYIRRRNDLTNDPNGQARQVISQSYEFIINNVGIDRNSGQLWKDWIQFIKSGPGQVGGSGWQDQQKMDQLRKAYHRAITVPMSALTELWKDYDQFELGLNKATGRQFIQKRSPAYMTAKSASLQLDRKITKLNRTSLPRLPPLPGFAGDAEFMEQVDIWKSWIEWEKEDPLVLLDDEPEVYKDRILYVYKQSLMALRFWPEMWVEAAEWCFANNIQKDGSDTGLKFLTDGIEANPESVLLAFKLADRVESTYPTGDSQESKDARVKAIRKPYDDVLNTLYKMMQKLKDREKSEVAKVEQSAPAPPQPGDRTGDDGDENQETTNSVREERIKAVKQGFSSQTELLKRTISFVWIALCRAARRTQGKGTLQSGLRGIFGDARARGQLTSDVYVAVAQLEHVVYKDPAGAKIFDRGAKLFPEDEGFMLEYIKFLHSKDDTTNARVVFETFVNRLTQTPEKKNRTKALYLYFHKYESQYGELSSIAALEKRMGELWPEDPKLSHFSNRHSVDSFNPVAYRLIICPRVQLRPKIMTSIEQPASSRNSPAAAPVAPAAPPAMRQTASPAPQYLGVTDSPKRPFPGDEQDEYNRPRKLARGESPLKGAAGRRLDQQRRNQVAPLARDINFFLGILPPSSSMQGSLFNAGKLANLIKDTAVPDFSTWRANQDRSMRQTSAQPRGAPPATASHGRHGSGNDYHHGSGRKSPSSRPISPYEGGPARRVASQAGYRASPLRPESGFAFDSQAGYGQPPQSQWPPPGAPQPPAGGPPSGWVPPPPAGFGQQQQDRFGQYQY